MAETGKEEVRKGRLSADNEKLPRLGRRRWLAQLGAEVGQRERE